MATQRTAIVTGGMGGLGESISIKLADAGYKVVVTYSPSNTKYRTWLEDMKSKGHAFAARDGEVRVFKNDVITITLGKTIDDHRKVSGPWGRREFQIQV